MPPRRKQENASNEPTQTCNSADAVNQFEIELAWCVRQLELGLCNQKPDSKQANEAIKVLKILKSDKAPMVKKRQAMRNTFGDYRQKIKEDEKKTVSKLKKPKMTQDTTETKKSVFYKKSLKSADLDYVTRMAAVNVNDDTPDSSGSQSLEKNNTQVHTSFKFGFPTPEKISNNINSPTDNPEIQCSGDNINNEVTCPSHDQSCDNKQPQSCAYFVMPKTNNNFRFNFEEPT